MFGKGLEQEADQSWKCFIHDHHLVARDMSEFPIHSNGHLSFQGVDFIK